MKYEIRYEEPDGLNWEDAKVDVKEKGQERVFRGTPKDKPGVKCEYAQLVNSSGPLAEATLCGFICPCSPGLLRGRGKENAR